MKPLTTTDFTQRAPDFETSGFHLRLARFNQRRLRPDPDSSHWQDRLADEIRMRHLEGLYLEHLRAEIEPWTTYRQQGTLNFIQESSRHTLELFTLPGAR